MSKQGFFATIIFLSILPSAARAQGQGAPRVEVGAQYSSLTIAPPDFLSENSPAVGARVTYNFTDYFAVEAAANFSVAETSRGYTTGGHYQQLQAGVKAGRRWRRFGLFAKARPGFISFGEAGRPEFAPVVGPEGVVELPFIGRERKTHFSMDAGGVLEFYPSRRVVVRFDAGDTLVRYGEHDEFGPAITLPDGGTRRTVVRARAEVKHNFQFEAGLGFRFGGGEETEPAGDTTAGGLRRFEVGAHFTTIFLNPPESRFGELNFPPFRDNFDPGARPGEGFGVRAGFNLSEHVALEAEGNLFPREEFANNSSGGRAVQFQAGVKAGRRWRRFGLFAKARPGFVNFNRVLRLTATEIVPLDGQQFVFPSYDTVGRTYFSMDVGGVVEYYPLRRFFTRFDVGDTIIRYGERRDTTFDPARPVRDIRPETEHNFQFSAGVGLRF